DREAWQQLFERTAHAEALLKLLQVKCISLLLESKNLTEIGNFWPILIEELTEKLGSENQVVKWLHTLPASLQQRFIQHLFETHGYPVTVLSQPLLVSEAFSLGLQEGYLGHLKSEQPITIRDKDLRGIDLSTLDLTNIELINCDLRLTGIFKNKTITKAHIEENRLDKKFFIQLLIHGNIDAIKLALSSTKALSLFHEKYRGLDFLLSHNHYSRMFLRIDIPTWQKLLYHIYQSLIESPSFTAQHLAQYGVLSHILKNRYVDLMRTFIGSPKCTTEAFKRVVEPSFYFSPEEQRYETTILHEIIRGLFQNPADKPVLLTMADMVLQSSCMKPEILLVKPMGNYDVLSYAMSTGQTEIVLKILNNPCCSDAIVRKAITETSKRSIKGYATILNNYINPPASYQAIYQKTEGSEFNKACALLSDYTKGGSAALRFFCGHWNRHYIKEVDQILRQVKRGQLSTLDELITVLRTIDPPNKAGSLTARTLFIVREHKKALQAPVVAPEPLTNTQPHL
ncbi:DUF5617 domain-containing protein, partial [Legionella dresdenensis]